jgi:hypothetical protein
LRRVFCRKCRTAETNAFPRKRRALTDGGIDGERLRTAAPHRLAEAGADGLLKAHAIAATYWDIHRRHRSAWTHELDLRPYKESF